MAELARTIKRLTAPLHRRMVLMIGRAIIRMVNDAGGHQELQLESLGGETMDGVERFQEYGFTSVPHPGATAVLGAVGGDRAHSIVIGVEDRRYRIRGMAGGEVAIHDDQGQRVHLMRDGIHVTTAQPGGVTMDAPVVTVNANRVTVNADGVDLGAAGGRCVARIGDMVAVGAGSSAGNWPIVSGSKTVKAT